MVYLKDQLEENANKKGFKVVYILCQNGLKQTKSIDSLMTLEFQLNSSTEQTIATQHFISKYHQ